MCAFIRWLIVVGASISALLIVFLLVVLSIFVALSLLLFIGANSLVAAVTGKRSEYTGIFTFFNKSSDDIGRITNYEYRIFDNYTNKDASNDGHKKEESSL